VTLLEREKLKPVDQQSEWAAAAQASCRSSRRGFAEMRRNEKKPVFPFRPGEKEKGEKYMNSVTSGMIIGREMFYQNRNEGRK
jgi:hypothetical protein